jgi:hypothetical protein
MPKLSTNHRPKKKIEAPSDIPEADDLISKALFASLITKICHNNYDGRRELRNKVSGCLRYAIKNGFIRDYGNEVKFGEAANYLRNKRLYANGLANLALPVKGYTHVVITALQGSFSGTNLPESVAECHKVIIEFACQVADLERRLATTEKQLAEQKPYVETGLKMRKPKVR